MDGRLCATLCATLFLLLSFSPLAIAQEKPEAPKRKTDRKVFLAGVSLLAASKTADAVTTRQLLDRGGWEGNPLFGRHPSPGTQAGINLGIFAAQSTAFYFTERSRHKWIRWTARALIGLAIEQHTEFAGCNAGIDTRSPLITHCGPL